MNRYRCGKCGQKITDRLETCPFCQARLVYAAPRSDKGAVMTATFSFLLIIYLAFFFGMFYERITQYLSNTTLGEKIQVNVEDVRD